MLDQYHQGYLSQPSKQQTSARELQNHLSDLKLLATHSLFAPPRKGSKADLFFQSFAKQDVQTRASQSHSEKTECAELKI